MHALCRLRLSQCKDPRCAHQRLRQEKRDAERARRKARLLRKEIQRRFPPGTLGVVNTRINVAPELLSFTVFGWGQTDKGWEALVLRNGTLTTWGWSTFEHCSTLEEVVRRG